MLTIHTADVSRVRRLLILSLLLTVGWATTPAIYWLTLTVFISARIGLTVAGYATAPTRTP